MLKDKIKTEAVYGSFLGLPSPVIVDLMGGTGYDFVIFDIEHGNYSNSELENCARAAAAKGLPYVIRIPCADQATIQKALDMGADGIMVSMVNDAETAEKVCKAALYPPKGCRGFSTHTIAGDFGYLDMDAFFENAERVMICVQIETKEGLDNLDEILSVNDTDMIFVGAADLSVSCDFESMMCDEAVSTYRTIAEKIKQAGKIPGILAFDEEMADMAKDLGYQFRASTIIGTISSAFEKEIKEIKEKK